MRICFITLSLRQNGGGSHKNSICYIRALREAGHLVEVHTLFSARDNPPPDITLEAEEGDGAPFLSLQNLCADAMKRSERMSDVFLVYGQALVWGAGMYRERGGVKPVAVYLDSHLDTMGEAHRGRSLFFRLKHLAWEKFYGLRFVRRIDGFLAVSPYLRDKYVSRGFPQEKFSIIPNMFDDISMVTNRSELAHKLRILYVGRFSQEKGTAVLLQALVKISASEMWEARFVGEGPEKDDIELRLRESGLVDRVLIMPWMDAESLAQEYADADIFVSPSLVPEPFGRTIVEAMHAGLPVIVSEDGGAKWVAGDAGITFQNGNEQSLVDAITRLLSDVALRKKLSARAKSRVLEFSAEKVTRVLSLALEKFIV